MSTAASNTSKNSGNVRYGLGSPSSLPTDKTNDTYIETDDGTSSGLTIRSYVFNAGIGGWSVQTPSPASLSLINGNTSTTRKIRLTDQTIVSDINIDDFFSVIPTKDATGKIIIQKAQIFRFGTTSPSFVATDSVNSTYIRTTDGLTPNATGSNIVDEWVLDSTNVWRIVSKSQDAVVSVTGATLPITFPTTTIPGTPIFTPNLPNDTTVVYQFTDGTLATWNGTQYIAAVSSNGVKKFRTVQNLVVGNNTITHSLNLVSPSTTAVIVDIRNNTTGAVTTHRVISEAANSIVVFVSAALTNQRITIIG
jgi:hypothetical protein